MKFLLALALILLTVNVKAQNLTLDQLLLLAGKNQEAIDLYLGARGWEQAPATDNANSTWAYAKRKDILNNDLLSSKYEALAWFHTLSFHGLPAISYDILSSAKYQIMKQRAIALGFKRITYTEDSQGSDSCYSNGKYKFYIHIAFSSDRFSDNTLNAKNSYEIAVTKIK
jgi:hypothetical protein